MIGEGRRRADNRSLMVRPARFVLIVDDPAVAEPWSTLAQSYGGLGQLERRNGVPITVDGETKGSAANL
jgi:hypothetical protein